MRNDTDIAIVSWATTPMVRHTGDTETTLLLHAITDALEPIGLTRADVDFTCAGSCDYISGATFSFVEQPRRHRRVAAQARLTRRDGRRVGDVRSVASSAPR